MIEDGDDNRLAALSNQRTLSSSQSMLTLFLVAWPVKLIFLLFVGLTGWVNLSVSLVCWILVAYGINVRREATPELFSR